MTNARVSAVPSGIPSEVEDDHDLLTFAIAGDRLRDEIAAEKLALAVAVETEGLDSPRAEQSRRRLEQLNRVLERQTAAREGRVNERDFFGEAAQ